MMRTPQVGSQPPTLRMSNSNTDLGYIAWTEAYATVEIKDFDLLFLLKASFHASGLSLSIVVTETLFTPIVFAAGFLLAATGWFLC